MSSSKVAKGVRPTSEQILVLREARKLKNLSKAETVSSNAGKVDSEKGHILSRPWLTVQEPAQGGTQQIKLMTWNLLAQCLVRRELFPTSDCLKAAEREHMIYREILFPNADIMCLQEVDRLEKLIPVIERAQYKHVFAAGPRKKHGLLIAYRLDAFEARETRVVHYDDMDVREEGSECGRKGSSFRTKNIASLVALGRVGNNGGVIVATTHLFWHPRYSYERARQAGILLRELLKFRDELGLMHWPCILAGDFNFPPDDPGYSLLTGDILSSEQKERLTESHVVHVSIDPSVPRTAPASAEEDEEGAADTSKKNVIVNARPAEADDGLLTSDELVSLYSTVARPRSVYDEGQRMLVRGHGQEVDRCGERLKLSDERHGAFEPEWTSYTHYWKTVLDYIFVVDPPDQVSSVLQVLKTHETESLGLGLPKMGVSGSDHISLCAELEWRPRT